jgi:hypothetical protein
LATAPVFVMFLILMISSGMLYLLSNVGCAFWLSAGSVAGGSFCRHA